MTEHHLDPYNGTELVQYKSSLILNVIIPNTQTLQLLTINVKTEIIYKRYKKCPAATKSSN